MEKGQLTLFDCRKVVSGKSWVVFSESDILQHKEVLLQPQSSMHLLLNTLRKLDCYKLEARDLLNTSIGSAAATVAALHPKPEVAKLASALVDKWRTQGDGQLFCQLEYDAEAAAAAPEGDPADFKLVAPPPPPPPPEAEPAQPTRVQPARGKDRETRYKEEEAYFDDSEAEGISEASDSGSDSDDDWAPGGARRKSDGKSSGGSSRKKRAKQ